MNGDSPDELRSALRRERAKCRQLEIALEAMRQQRDAGHVEAELRRTRADLDLALRSWGRLEHSLDEAMRSAGAAVASTTA